MELNNGIKTIYKTCGSIEEFELRINQITRDNRKYKSFEIIYLAFLGSKNNIIFGETEYSLNEIDLLLESKLNDKIIHFGNCKTLLYEKQARDFLKITCAKAISGYIKIIDFIESTALDILYFNPCQEYQKRLCATSC